MFKDITGQRFNRLTAIKYLGARRDDSGRTKGWWLCQCDCGNTCEVCTSHLTSGHTKSCGCWASEQKCGANNNQYSHGCTGKRIYRIYKNMKNRCLNKNLKMYPYYGGRGITICNEWLGKCGFDNFYKWAIENGYREDLTIDRIDNNGNYCPKNCKWSTVKEQMNNKRTTHYLKINGEIDTVGNWASRLNISYENLRHYSNGMKNNKYPNLKIEVVNEGIRRETTKMS